MSAPRSRRIDLDTGLAYHVLEWEPADDGQHTVVLVHGFLDLAWAWQPTVEAGLAGRFHIVAPDMRGHGDSDRVGAGGYYHFMDYVADLASLITRVGRERVSLVGHSMGGVIASNYTGAFPERVHKLALLEGLGPPADTRSMPERIRGWVQSWTRLQRREPQPYESVAVAAERLRKHDPMLSHEASLKLARHSTRPTADGGVAFKHDPLHLTRGPYPFQLELAEQLWRNIECPVLAVDANQSTFRMSPDDEARRQAVFARLERRTIEGAGHMMHRHQPAQLAQLLLSFLSESADGDADN